MYGTNVAYNFFRPFLILCCSKSTDQLAGRLTLWAKAKFLFQSSFEFAS
jgi:hypothetical protein